MFCPLTLLIAGNVDDGKSTLIGRLLYDSKSLYEDHLQSLKLDSAQKGKTGLDFSLLTDGLIAERKQGITIDVAYRYFSTPKRDFILADTPGHQQYIGNMAAAASRSDVLVLVLSIESPLSLQAKRHSKIASLFGIQQVVIAINKLDLSENSEKQFLTAKKEYEEFAATLSFNTLHFIPISALKGENILNKSSLFPWYCGPSLIELLEMTPSFPVQNSSWRLGIQLTLQTKTGSAFYAGTLQGGKIRKGEEAICYPSGKRTKIAAIIHREKEVDEAQNKDAIALELHPEIEAAKGCILAPPNHPLTAFKKLTAQFVLFEKEKIGIHQPYIFIHMNQTAEAQIRSLNATELEGFYLISIDLDRIIYADAYRENKTGGSFILVDPETLRTIGAGLIQKPKQSSVIWFTGLSGSGKTTLASALKKALEQRGKQTYLLDGDLLRKGLNSDLSFSLENRHESVRRAAEVAALFADAGFIAITALISPFAQAREKARLLFAEGQFFEIYLSAPLSCCEKRDLKKHYQAAREGLLKDFTGISSPYEPPQNPELTLDTSQLSVEECVQLILKELDV